MIHVEGIGKQYKLGGTIAHGTLRDTIAFGFRDLFGGKGKKGKRKGPNTFWALKDVSFDVREGEVLGVIGPNGAGKSTLLKVISRITPPTEGQIRLKGRVASMLEVGTGFHPELSGAENIYLNGAILGMSRREIKAQFDEIVEFAEVSQFLDTPVKRYSSGMYVRLAFAVAAHLQPEIMVVDEVLAVGDAAFQKKCLGKMEEVSESGRTVLFVSHNMAAIKTLCTSAMLLEKGRVSATGKVDEVIDCYFQAIEDQDFVPLSERTDRRGSGDMTMTNVELVVKGSPANEMMCGDDLGLRVTYEGKRGDTRKTLLVGIYDSMNSCAIYLDSDTTDDLPKSWPKNGTVHVRFGKGFSLGPGRYSVNVALVENDQIADYVQAAMGFEVTPGIFYPTGRMPRSKTMFLVEHDWDVTETA